MDSFRPVPKRNIWKATFDIRHKADHVFEPVKLSSVVDLKLHQPRTKTTENLLDLSENAEKGSVFWIRLLRPIAVTAAIVLFASGGVIGLSFVRNVFDEKKASISENIPSILAYLNQSETSSKDFNFSATEASLTAADQELNNIELSLGKPYGIAVYLSKFLPDNATFLAPLQLLQYSKEMVEDMRQSASMASQVFDNGAAMIMQPDQPSMLPLLESIRINLNQVSFLAVRIANILPNVSRILGRNDAVLNFAQSFPKKETTINDALGSTNAFIQAINGTKTYLLLFQNPAEIRPTGGFIGSYGILKITNGKVASFNVDDIYNPDGQLQPKFNVIPPKPLQWITTDWGARDANWFFDFPTSAKKVEFFLEQGTGDEHFDGVMALNPSVIEGLLTIVGPVDMPEYKKTITADNFYEETEYQTRVGIDRQTGNDPKKFLEIFGPRLLDKMKTLNKGDLPKLLALFDQSLGDKEMQIYLNDPAQEAFIEKHGWSGEVASTDGGKDYLAVVLSNVGGAKADYLTANDVHLETSVGPDGYITDTVKITRSHEGYKSIYSWFRGQNRTYVRVYVPKNSILLSTSGAIKDPSFPVIDYSKHKEYVYDADVLAAAGVTVDDPALRNVEIGEESGKTYFAGWMILNDWQTKTLSFTYRLPFRASFSEPQYDLVLQKQSGVPQSFEYNLSLPNGSIITSNNVASSTATDLSSWQTDSLKKDTEIDIPFKFPQSL